MMTNHTSAVAPPAQFPREILELGALAAAEHDLPRLFDSAIKAIKSALGVDGCHIYRFAAGTEDIQLVAGDSGPAFDESLALTQRTLEQTRPHSARSKTFFDSADARAISVLIPGETAPFGVLALTTRLPRVYSALDVEISTWVAAVLTGALKKAHSGRARAELASIMSGTQEAVVGFANDGRIFNWNQAAADLFGYTSDEIMGRQLEELFPPATPIGIADAAPQTIAGSFETMLLKSDGSQVEGEVTFTPIPDRAGRIVAGSMIVRDLRPKHRDARSIRMHTEILSNMPAALLVWRLDRPSDPSSLRLVTGNDAADRLIGSSLAERKGTPIAAMRFRLGAHPSAEDYAAVARSAVARDFGETWLTQPDGTRACFHIKAFPLPDQSVGVVFNDVTERLNLADRLEQSLRLEVIGRLAAGVAHDFNNILTVITGYAQLLRPDLENNQLAMRDLREIERASESAHQLTRQLLAFGRNQPFRPETLDLQSLVQSARGMLGRLIGEDIVLVVPEQNPVHVFADAGQLEQVLLNLAANARDAMPAGGKLFIETKLQRVTSDSPAFRDGVAAGVYGMLEFTDTGIGMDPALISRVFEPFFTTKSEGRGTGLGLATVYGIVKQSGGYITLDSKQGVGTTFRIYLPIGDVVDETETDASEHEDSNPSDDIICSSDSQTVMVVEDDERVRSLVRSILAGAGYTVLSASSPESALQLANQFTGTIDLLLTDVVMPLQSGPELAARLTASFPTLRVLYMSGYRPEVHGHRTVPAGAPFINKPFLPQALLVCVKRALDPTEFRPENPTSHLVM